jgi:hypothetical protein
MRRYKAKAILLLLAGALTVGLVAWALATGSSEAQQDGMYNCPQPGKWAISVWDGADGSETGEALAACGEGVVDFAYYLDPETNGWLGYFEGHADISQLLALNGKQGIIAHGVVSAPPPTPSPEPTPSPQESAMHNCPQAGKWAISVWSGADGTATGQALAACEPGTVDFAYSLDPGTNGWLGYFEGHADISKLLTLNNMQGIVAHGSAGFSLAVDKFGEGTVASSPEGIDCGTDCTSQAATYPSGTTVVLTPTADPGSAFSYWSGCDSVSGDSCTVDMDGDHTVFATFAFTEVKIPETTKVLDAATMGHLIRQEGSTYYFDSQATAVASLKAGDVIVSGVGEGFIRKVTAINVTDQEIAVETADATLEDAIQRGTIVVHKTLTPSDLQAAQAVDNEDARADQIAASSSLPFFNEYNVGLSQGVSLSGSLSFEPTLDFAVSFDGLKPVEARSVLTFRQRTDLNLDAESSFSMGVERKIWPPPGSPPLFAPIIVPVGIPPFVVPVVLVPDLGVSVGVSGSSVSSVESGITVDTTVVAGVHYTSRGGWKPVADYSQHFSFNPPTLSESTEVKAYVSPELSVRVYGIVGPYVNLEGYGKLTADPAKSPWWGLYAGLEAHAGFSVDFPIMGRVLDYHATVLQLEWLLAQAGSKSTPTDGKLSLEQYFQQVQAIWDDYDEQEAAVSRQFPAGFGEPEATQKGFSAVTAIFREALGKQDDLDPPAEAQEAHQEFLAAGRVVLEGCEDTADRLAEAESWSEVEELISDLLEDPEIVAARDRFTDACFALEAIAHNNDIDVDLDCEED